MTVSVKMLNDSIRKISDTNSLLDMLLEFEKVLDTSDVYAYKNWIQGEVLDGPKLSRHWVTVRLIYPQDQMPDPDGAKRIMLRGGQVRFKKGTLIVPRKVKSFDDVSITITGDGRQRYKTKTESSPIWIVEIKLPRKYVDEFVTDNIEVDEDSYVDMEALNAESEMQAEAPVQQNDGLGGLI